MSIENITTKKFDIFIAYHGAIDEGSAAYAKEIYSILKDKRVNGRKLEVFLQTEVNYAGQFSITPQIAQNSTLFLLVASNIIPREENGTLLQKDNEGLEKRLYQEVNAFAESIYYRKNPTTSTRVIACGGLRLDEAARLHFIFNGKNNFYYDDIVSDKTNEFFRWIQASVGVFDFDDNFKSILNTTPIPYHSSFITRYNELKEIDRMLEKDNFLIITANVSGMGVNTLSKNYAREFSNKFKYIHYIENPKSTVDFILSLSFKGYENYDLLPADIQYLKKKDLFLKLESDSLIIVSDFDIDYTRDEEFHGVFAYAKCKVIITSSYASNDYPCLKLESMSNDDLLSLFRHYCPYEYSDDKLIEFFNKVEKHTSVITLAANLISSTDIELEEVMEEMLSVDEVVYSNQTRTYDSVNNHLLNVFNLSKNYLSESDLEILSMLTLIDVNGIERSRLTSQLNISPAIVNELNKKGYLYFSNEKPVKAFLPTVLSNLIYHNFKPNEKTYLEALKLINSFISYDETKSYTLEHHKKSVKYGEFIINKRELLNNIETVVMLNDMANHYHAIADLSNALKIANLALDIYKKVSSDLLVYTKLCISKTIILEDMGKYREAYEIVNLLLEKEGLESLDNYYLGVLYNLLGAINRRMGKYNESLVSHKKALEIFMLLDDGDYKVKQGMANAYNDIGSTYEKLGDKIMALDNKLEALRIREELLDPNHPDIAKSYNNIAHSYNRLEDYEEALAYENKSLEIRSKILPQIHPDIAKIYNNMAYSHRKLNQYDEAILYYDKAININKQASGASLPNLIFSLHHKALVYVDLDMIDKAIEVLKMASIYALRCYYDDTLKLYEELIKLNERIGNLDEVNNYKLKIEEFNLRYGK